VPNALWPSDTRRMSWFGRSARWLFPAIFLVYVLQTVTGVSRYSTRTAAVVGYVGIGVFCSSYLLLLTTIGGQNERRFWMCFAVMIIVCIIELVIAHQYAESMFVFIGVPLIARRIRAPSDDPVVASGH
jgi:hypothetical protein